MTSWLYPERVIDPFKKAKDDDREAAADVVRAALANDRISEPDHDLRLQRVDQAQTIAELQAITRDLPAVTNAPAPAPQRPTDLVGATRSATPSAQIASRPEAGGRTLVGIIVAVVILVVLLGVGLAGVLFVGAVGGGSVSEVVVSERAQPSVGNLTSAGEFDGLVDAVERKTGSTVVFSATVYPRYAVVEVPVAASSQRSYGWYYDGSWQRWTGRGTARTERFDLADLEGRVVAATLRKAGKLVEDPTSTYVLVGSAGREPGTCLSAYATNDDGETAYVDATCDGRVVRRYVS